MCAARQATFASLLVVGVGDCKASIKSLIACFSSNAFCLPVVPSLANHSSLAETARLRRIVADHYRRLAKAPASPSSGSAVAILPTLSTFDEAALLLPPTTSNFVARNRLADSRNTPLPSIPATLADCCDLPRFAILGKHCTGYHEQA